MNSQRNVSKFKSSNKREVINAKIQKRYKEALNETKCSALYFYVRRFSAFFFSLAKYN